MKRLLLIGPLVALCVLAGLTFLSRYRRDYFVTATRTYATIQEAAKEGALTTGWLPDFLPHSARDIREKHNYEQNTAIAAFSFDPSDDLTVMLNKAEELPASFPEGARPRAVGRREAWFPGAIMEGKPERLSPPGFRLYRIERRARVGQDEVLHVWHLALNREAGVCYLWFLER